MTDTDLREQIEQWSYEFDCLPYPNEGREAYGKLGRLIKDRERTAVRSALERIRMAIKSSKPVFYQTTDHIPDPEIERQLDDAIYETAVQIVQDFESEAAKILEEA